MENENKNLKITSFEELKNISKGSVVELPPFADGQPFVARLKRPSMFVLAKNGKIPNSLLTQANNLFENGVANSFDSLDEDMLTKCFDIFDLMCEASFVEPTYKEIKESGVELTDEQYMFIFGYAQNGVRQLESFRK
jgi:hypothetical protein